MAVAERNSSNDSRGGLSHHRRVLSPSSGCYTLFLSSTSSAATAPRNGGGGAEIEDRGGGFSPSASRSAMLPHQSVSDRRQWRAPTAPATTAFPSAAASSDNKGTATFVHRRALLLPSLLFIATTPSPSVLDSAAVAILHLPSLPVTRVFPLPFLSLLFLSYSLILEKNEP
ncbi:hypothetical protein PIB30_034428 [Stylosanthes scabra]|uniref:Uncharacterized protein n=1 Tax=Stylosanthes scabra TaxID=79078 RepID=A0ABU6RD26_9FABA|nr:hypothetical protein [Stylosanthes scabra]